MTKIVTYDYSVQDGFVSLRHHPGGVYAVYVPKHSLP